MQVMPFWPNELGLSTRDLIDVELNIRMGTSILAYYLERERGDYRRALGRYNGSLGRRTYPDLVLGRLNARWRH
ncbi:MAG: lytic transglycosylase domain-containing protein, partial [Steroidobacteraceae bacterium]